LHPASSLHETAIHYTSRFCVRHCRYYSLNPNVATMIRDTCIVSHLFFDKTSHDRINVELHKDQGFLYVFYKSKFGTFRSASAAVDPDVSNKLHELFGKLYPDMPDLVSDMNSWLQCTLESR